MPKLSVAGGDGALWAATASAEPVGEFGEHADVGEVSIQAA